MSNIVRHKLVMVAAAATLLLGGLGTTAFIGHAQTTPPAQSSPATNENDAIQDPSYTGSIAVDDQATTGLDEAAEASSLQGLATVSPADAEAAALAANPGATVVKTELDNENGSLIYSVELSNGMDVKVDAGNAAVLYTDQGEDGAEAADANDTDNVQDEQEDGDQDSGQEEHEVQPGGTNQAPGAEVAPSQ
ncbi:MAG: PepSY domain-containing protein [Caldilineales bacterium]